MRSESADPYRDHLVQFYRDEPSLMKTVSRFVREGLMAGQPIVVIATAQHRHALVTSLVADGVPPDHFENSGMLWLFDAREVLDLFMVDGRPDPAKFRQSVGQIIAAARGRREGAHVRAYGEMVDLLWRDGNAEAAIRLETLWNTLASAHRFSLLCGYALGSFYKETSGFDIGDVCNLHTHVLPA
jgi:hypothetical protein